MRKETTRSKFIRRELRLRILANLTEFRIMTDYYIYQSSRIIITRLLLNLREMYLMKI